MSGSAAGMREGPLSPTVYSVARNVPALRGRVLPSGIVRRADVFPGNSTRAVRLPASSVTSPPEAICIAGVPKLTSVDFASKATITTSGAKMYLPHCVATRRWMGKKPDFSRDTTKLSPPFTARSKSPFSRVNVYPYSGFPNTFTFTPGSGFLSVSKANPFSTDTRRFSMAPGATPTCTASGAV